MYWFYHGLGWISTRSVIFCQKWVTKKSFSSGIFCAILIQRIDFRGNLLEEKMENRERYKRLIMFLASAVIIAIETLLFAYIWYKFYAHKEVIGRRFDRGNQVVIGLYVLMIYFFYKIYGGFKVGYLRVFEVIYSQILSVCCVNLCLCRWVRRTITSITLRIRSHFPPCSPFSTSANISA